MNLKLFVCQDANIIKMMLFKFHNIRIVIKKILSNFGITSNLQ